MSDNDSDININDADDALIDKRIPKKSKGNSTHVYIFIIYITIFNHKTD